MKNGDKKLKNTRAVRVKNQLREEILSGKYAENQMLPTEAELCQQFGISRLTIRKSFDFLIEDGLCERIPSRGVIVSSRNGIESYPKRQQEIQILTEYPYQTDNYYYRAILAGFVGASLKYGVSIAFTERKAETPLIQYDFNQPTVVWPATTRDLTDIYHLMQDSKNFVVLSASYDDLDVPSVDCDNQTGAESAMSCFLVNGHSRIGIMTKGANMSLDHSTRLVAAKNFVRKQDEKLVVPPVFVPGRDISQEEADENLLTFIQQNQLTGLFVMDLELADWVYNFCQRKGVVIPGDLSIISFDDSEIADLYHPSLTTISQPLVELGRRSVERLVIGSDNNQGTELLATKLIERNSVKNLDKVQEVINA